MLIAVPDACLWWLLIARPYQQVLFIPACTECTFYPDYNCTISNTHTFSCLPARGDSSAWIHCRPKASTYSLHLQPSCLQRLIKIHSYTLWRYRSLTPRAHAGSVIKNKTNTLLSAEWSGLGEQKPPRENECFFTTGQTWVYKVCSSEHRYMSMLHWL